MAGHSKWANIKHRKAAADSKKSKITTRLVKEITIAAKMGGSDLDSNPRLRLAVEKARENNIPKDNVERAIKRGAGEIDGADYVELRFEGYGFGGSGIIVDCLTDNNTRTVAEVRHAFSKFGGNMGTSGCVAFQFTHCGQLIFAPGADEDKLTELAIDSGALDIVTNDEDGSIEITTSPEDFITIKSHLEQNGFKAEFAEVVMKAHNEIQLNSEESQKMQRLVDELEALDDVQDVYHNAILDL